MELSALQSAWVAYLSDPSSDNPLCRVIQRSATLSAHQRAEIYRESMIAAKLNLLDDRFPVCMRLVGKNYFWQLTRAYIREHPVQSASLTFYGEDFPAWCEHSLDTETLFYLPEVAQFEWAWHVAIYRSDAVKFDPHVLSAMSQEKQFACRFQHQLNGTLLKTKTPVRKIIAMNQMNDVTNVEIDLAAGGEPLFIWRDADTLRADPLTESEYTLLHAFKAPCALHDLSETVLSTIATTFPLVLQRGFLMQVD